MDSDDCNQRISDIINYMEKLEIEKENSIKEGNYDLTDQLNSKIAEVKKTLSVERKKQIVLQHGVEIESLENCYKKELDEFNVLWDEKFKKLEEKSKGLEDNLNDKHGRQMTNLYEFLEDKLPKNVMYSKQYLETKNMSENLVKCGKFKDAASMKKKLGEIEKQDTEKFNKDKYEKIKSESIKTANKHMNEKLTLKRKIDIEFEILKKERQKNLETLLLKYKNRKLELEKQQRQELIYLENENLLKKSKII